jgi:internalin A
VQITGLTKLTQLKKLNFESTRIQQIEGLDKLTQLQDLDLANTRIEAITGLSKLTNLENLNLSDTDIQTTTGLGKLTQLQSLDLSDTYIEKVSGLSKLIQLKSLDLSNTEIENITGLDKLTQLQSLVLYETYNVQQIIGLDKLTQLQSLDLRGTQLKKITGLSKLTQLQTLLLSGTQLKQITGLDKLTKLQDLDLTETDIQHITGLDKLTQLQSLNLSRTPLKQIMGLGKLTHLQSLDLSGTDIQKITELNKLTQLQSLDLSSTKIQQINGLNALTQLKSLDLSETQLEQIGGLNALTQLQTLNLSETKLKQITGLDNLTQLQSLYLRGLNLNHFPESLLYQTKFEEFICDKSQIKDIPTAILSTDIIDNCIDRVRHHFDSLKYGHQTINDMKLMVLGNGQIGKTQLCRRLCDEDYDPNIPSTHGILIKQTLFADTEQNPVKLNLWDFGGQEIYHGTHSLFLNSQQTTFLVLWLPSAENKEIHTVNGMQFRNHLLDYWLEHINQQNGGSGSTTPVIIAQAQCDDPQDGETNPPVVVGLKKRFPFVKVIATSAKNPDGLDELTPALRKAVAYNQQQNGRLQIANSWLRVKHQLENWIAEDSNKPKTDRVRQLLSRQSFFELCQGKNELSLNPALIVEEAVAQTVLRWLHHTGVVFYQEDLFNGQILLDQSWALNAIYGVFHRETALLKITENKGEFYADDLANWLWNKQGYSQKEQALFLQMMQSCGVCFSYQRSHEDKVTYIVPELLLDAQSNYVSGAIERNWQDKDSKIVSQEFEVDLLHNALFNRILALIGEQAREGAIYWKNGLLAYENTHKSWLIFERKMASDWKGTFTLSTRNGNSEGLLANLICLIEQEQKNWIVKLTKKSRASKIANKITNQLLNFKQTRPEVCISYKWNNQASLGEDRELIVNQFCQAAEKQGVEVIRDITSLQLGDKLSTFMQRIGAGQRVIVILSDAYLKSPNCMFELYEIWRNSRADATTFAQQVKAFRLPGLQIDDLECQMEYSIYWKDKFENIKTKIEKHGAEVLGEKGYQQYVRIQSFHLQISNILQEISDTLGPQDLDQLLEYGLKGLELNDDTIL